MSLAARAPGGGPHGEFVPYVRGATLGCPSKGRPERVLAHLKNTTATWQEDGVPGSDGRAGRVTARGTLPDGPSRNGMPAGGGYVYGGTGQDTGVTAAMGAARLRHEAERAVPGAASTVPEPARRRRAVTRLPAPLPEPEPVPVPEAAPKPRKPWRRAVLTARCPGCGRPKPDKYATCGGAGPCLAPAAEPAPAPVPEPAPLPVPEPEAAPAPAKRHRKCGYPFGTVGHKTACGGDA